MNKWEELVNELKKSMEDMKEEILESSYPEDLLSEIVDGVIPIYNYELLAVAADNYAVCYMEDEGLNCEKSSVFQMIQIGIYENLISIAYEILSEFKDV